MYQDFGNGLGRERMEQVRTQVERNRLEARLAKTSRFDEDGAARRGRVARGSALIMALFR
jgi:hypothetical protein